MDSATLIDEKEKKKVFSFLLRAYSASDTSLIEEPNAISFLRVEHSLIVLKANLHIAA